MGSLFVGLILIAKNWKNLKSLFLNFLLFSIWPAGTLLINWFRGRDVQYNSMQWLVYNWQTYKAYNFTFFKWVSINLSTFNVAWIAVFVGLYFLYKNRKNIDNNLRLFLLVVIPSSLSYFGWSLFISRTVFVSAWLVLPIAAYGIYELYNAGYKKISMTLSVLIIVAPYFCNRLSAILLYL